MNEGTDDVRVSVRVKVSGVAPKPTKATLLLLNVTLPVANGTANVLAAPGAASGSICATGDGAIKNGNLASWVYAKVYPGNLTTVPFNPPPMTDYTVPYGSKGQWKFSLLGGAACNADGTAANTLVTWTDFGGPGYDVDHLSFTGKCANSTDCGPGTGSSSGSVSGSGIGIIVDSGSARTVPRQWTVVGVGFSGALAPFNGLWLLSARDADGLLGWDNGSDGNDNPGVELVHDVGHVWRLSFRYAREAVCYEKPEGGWQPLNANILAGPTQATQGPQTLPAYVTVVPV